MQGAVRVWRSAGARLWDNLPRLIVVNVLWLIAAWPLLTLGAATLTAYAWLRRAVLEAEDERRERDSAGPSVPEEPYTTLPRYFRRLWWPGTLWAALNGGVGLMLTADLTLARARSGTLAGAAWDVVGVYLAWLWLALQPFLLDALSEGWPLTRALAEAARITLAYPLYAHLCALPLLALLALSVGTGGGRVLVPWLTAGMAALLLYWACVATGDPAPRQTSSPEDLL